MSSPAVTAGDAVRQRLWDWVVANHDTTRFSMPAQGFSQPVPDPTNLAATSWIRVTDRVLEAEPMGIGNDALRRMVGVVIVEVVTAAGAGDDLARSYADSIADQFRGQTDESGALFYREPLSKPSNVEEADLYRHFVEIPYTYQFVPSAARVEVGYPVTTITQAANGFAAGDAVYNNAGTWAKAQADAEATLADGVVVSAPTTAVAHISVGPTAKITAHGLGSGGADLFLSQGTAGLLTSTQPTSGIAQRFATVIDADNLQLHGRSLVVDIDAGTVL